MYVCCQMRHAGGKELSFKFICSSDASETAPEPESSSSQAISAYLSAGPRMHTTLKSHHEIIDDMDFIRSRISDRSFELKAAFFFDEKQHSGVKRDFTRLIHRCQSNTYLRKLYWANRDFLADCLASNRKTWLLSKCSLLPTCLASKNTLQMTSHETAVEENGKNQPISTLTKTFSVSLAPPRTMASERLVCPPTKGCAGGPTSQEKGPGRPQTELELKHVEPPGGPVPGPFTEVLRVL